MKKLLILTITTAALLAVPSTSLAAATLVKTDMKCVSPKSADCKVGKKVGVATTRGSSTRSAYTPASTTFVVDSLRKGTATMRLEVTINCASQLSDQSTNVTKNFSKKVAIKKGRNVLTLPGKALKCPSGFINYGGDHRYSIDVRSGVGLSRGFASGSARGGAAPGAA